MAPEYVIICIAMSKDMAVLFFYESKFSNRIATEFKCRKNFVYVITI